MDTARVWRWGVCGTGGIATDFVNALCGVPDAALVAVGSRTASGAERFGRAHGVPPSGWCASYEDLARCRGLDAVYIATPNALHAPCARLFLTAGLAVLCEKPFAVTGTEAAAVLAAARTSRALCAEGMWTLHFPAVRALLRLAAAGALGCVTRVEASFGCEFGAEDLEGNFGKREMGGGALLDIGVYPVALAVAVARAVGHDVDNGAGPEVRTASATLLPSGVDAETDVELVFSVPCATGACAGEASGAGEGAGAGRARNAGAQVAAVGEGAGAGAGAGAPAPSRGDAASATQSAAAGTGTAAPGTTATPTAPSTVAARHQLTCSCRASARRDLPNEAWVYGTRAKCRLVAPFWAPDTLQVYPVPPYDSAAGSAAGGAGGPDEQLADVTAVLTKAAAHGAGGGGDDDDAGATAAATATVRRHDGCVSLTVPLPERAARASCAENFDNTRGMAYQITAVQRALAAGSGECDVVSHGSTMAVMRVLDAVRKRVGVVYPQDADSEAARAVAH